MYLAKNPFTPLNAVMFRACFSLNFVKWFFKLKLLMRNFWFAIFVCYILLSLLYLCFREYSIWFLVMASLLFLNREITLELSLNVWEKKLKADWIALVEENLRWKCQRMFCFVTLKIPFARRFHSNYCHISDCLFLLFNFHFNNTTR